MANDTVTLIARYVFPVTGPPLLRGLLTVRDDRIVAVEPYGSRTADFDCGDAAIVPGFVNAHTHLDLSVQGMRTPPTADFPGWLDSVMRFRQSRPVDAASSDLHGGVLDVLRFGTTLVGDISHEGATWDELVVAPVRAVVFRELIGAAEQTAGAAWAGFQRWAAALPPCGDCTAGVSPHAPYSARESLIERAAQTKLPLTIHLAESAAEIELIAKRTGPFVEFLHRLGAWSPEDLVRSLERVIQICSAGGPCVFAHCNYLPISTKIPANCSIVYCPRTHAAFAHPPHPFREFFGRGVRVALGTDSLASNPDLDSLGEARFVHARCPELPGRALLRMATLSGAEALGFGDVTGSLSPGKSADFAIVALPPRGAADPHEEIFDSDLPVIATIYRGRRVLVGDIDGESLPGLPLPIVQVV
jgi:cytosine/adenosine deaminase-related metal-dependent hydrolase